MNILRYLWGSVSLWIGAGNSYEVHEDYKKYLSEERILKAIQEEVDSKQIFMLRDDIIFRCAAFYLNSLGAVELNRHISQDSVDKVVKSWEISSMQ